MRTIILIILTITMLNQGDLFSQDQDILSLIERGQSFYKNREIDSALYYYNLAIEKDPASEEAYFARALARTKNRDNEGAIEDYREAICLDPKPVYYNNIGIIFTLEEYHEKALEEYNKALELDPAYTQAIFNKGISYHHLGMPDEACVFVGKAKEQGFQLAEQYFNEYCQ